MIDAESTEVVFPPVVAAALEPALDLALEGVPAGANDGATPTAALGETQPSWHLRRAGTGKTLAGGLGSRWAGRPGLLLLLLGRVECELRVCYTIY